MSLPGECINVLTLLHIFDLKQIKFKQINLKQINLKQIQILTLKCLEGHESESPGHELC